MFNSTNQRLGTVAFGGLFIAIGLLMIFTAATEQLDRQLVQLGAIVAGKKTE